MPKTAGDNWFALGVPPGPRGNVVLGSMGDIYHYPKAL
jgi:hypothetical protein